MERIEGRVPFAGVARKRAVACHGPMILSATMPPPIAVALLTGVLVPPAVALAAFRRRLARAVPEPSRWPRVAVVSSCKGADPMMAANAATLLAQDYPGEREAVFVVPVRSDPAFAALSGLAGARLVVSDADPRRASEQNENLLFALRALGPGPEVLVFADADQRVRPDWLRRLVAALLEEGVGVSTAPAVFIPEGAGAAGALRHAWVAYGLPFMAALGWSSGQSQAVRRADFDAWGAAGLWGRTINMDLTLSALARRAGRRVVHVPRAAPLWHEPCSWGQVFGPGCGTLG